MKLDKFESMENSISGEILLKTAVKFSRYDLECMKAELCPEEFRKLLAEHITHEIIKEIERRDI